jgi:cell shape-determining protein MreD
VGKKVLKIGEQFLIISGIQLFLSNYCPVVVPSFFLIWLLILSWEGNRITALIMAFFTGLIYDLMNKGVPGISSLIFLLIVYINCFVEINSLFGRIAGTFIFSIIYFVLMATEPITGLMWNKGVLIKYAFLFGLYNCILLLIIECAMRKLRWRKKHFLTI